tara:strand:- start:2861 stop:3922 length:1062 start_codon:yes stop_codon:yes gene_type:complete
MALLEYATFTVPDVVKKSVNSFYNQDPLLQALQSRHKVKRSGGTHVRIRRIKSGHSSVVEINATNMGVPLNKIETFSQMTGDWARYIKPIILPHIDRDRMQSKEDRANWVKDTTEAAMISLKNDVIRRLYIGDSTTTALSGLGTLNGAIAGNGTSSGLENGALRFESPTAQAGNQYLNETRVEDTTGHVNNWYNQYAVGTIGTNFLEKAEQVKITADTFTEDSEGISLGVLSIADQVSLGAEVRSYPGGSNGGIMYTVEDIKSGKAHPTVWMVGGIRYYSNRWMTVANMGKTGAAYLLNPNAIEYWVNANNDFRATKFTDHLATSNQDADIGYIVLESQFVVPNLLANGTISQ